MGFVELLNEGLVLEGATCVTQVVLSTSMRLLRVEANAMWTEEEMYI